MMRFAWEKLDLVWRQRGLQLPYRPVAPAREKGKPLQIRPNGDRSLTGATETVNLATLNRAHPGPIARP